MTFLHPHHPSHAAHSPCLYLFRRFSLIVAQVPIYFAVLLLRSCFIIQEVSYSSDNVLLYSFSSFQVYCTLKRIFYLSFYSFCHTMGNCAQIPKQNSKQKSNQNPQNKTKISPNIQRTHALQISDDKSILSDWNSYRYEIPDKSILNDDEQKHYVGQAPPPNVE